MFSSISTFVSSNSSLLISGLLSTLSVIVYAVLISIPGGLIFGAIRTVRFAPLRFASRAFLELYRSLPMPLLLIAGFFLLPQTIHIQLSGELVAIIVFSIWGSVEVGELIRGALESLPKIQSESGRSLGLSATQLFAYVLVPQALPRILPGMVTLLTRMVKCSSMLIMVGVVDIVKQTKQIIERTDSAMAGYTVLALVFFMLCFPLSQVARALEKRLGAQEGERV